MMLVLVTDLLMSLYISAYTLQRTIGKRPQGKRYTSEHLQGNMPLTGILTE